MMMSHNGWMVAFVAFILLASSGCSYSNEDSPVTSTGQVGIGSVEGIVGRITDTRGRPVVGALVQPRSLDDPSPPIPEIAIVSDDNGRYTWQLSPGSYELSVSADGYRGMTKLTKVKAGQAATLDFTLERTPY